jgi:hypothetical protein
VVMPRAMASSNSALRPFGMVMSATSRIMVVALPSRQSSSGSPT